MRIERATFVNDFQTSFHEIIALSFSTPEQIELMKHLQFPAVSDVICQWKNILSSSSDLMILLFVFVSIFSTKILFLNKLQ